MFTPLMFTGIGELILILLIVAFVAAMFCLMLIGLGALIAFPLMLIMPFFGKKVKWDKDSFLGWLLFTPIAFLLGMIGIDLAKIFGQFCLDVVKRFPVISGILICIVGGAILSVLASNMINYKLSKESRVLANQIKQAERDYNFSLIDTLKEKQGHIEKDIKKREKWILLFSCAIIGVLYGIFCIIVHT